MTAARPSQTHDPLTRDRTRLSRSVRSGGAWLLAARRIPQRAATLVSVTVLLMLGIAAAWPTNQLPFDPTTTRIIDRMVPIGGTDSLGQNHLLGTDALGRDLVSVLAYSARYSLLIALGAAAVTTLAAVLLGVSAGYRGGILDVIVMRAVDVLLSLPVILVAVALAAVIGRSLIALTGILVITGWADYTRVIRAEALARRDIAYVEASKVAGASDSRIVLRTILPNVFSTMVVMSTYLVSRFILLESSVSFLGMGVTPPASSWGVLVGDARQYIFQAPLLSVLPGLLIVLTVLAVNFLGDGIRDLRDPFSRTLRTA
jgi:ABC-type dipeptide/oligopeptide/nickel transport system permease subunit